MFRKLPLMRVNCQVAFTAIKCPGQLSNPLIPVLVLGGGPGLIPPPGSVHSMFWSGLYTGSSVGSWFDLLPWPQPIARRFARCSAFSSNGTGNGAAGARKSSGMRLIGSNSMTNWSGLRPGAVLSRHGTEWRQEEGLLVVRLKFANTAMLGRTFPQQCQPSLVLGQLRLLAWNNTALNNCLHSFILLLGCS